MPDFTIIIPHRGPTLGLWATIQSCEEDLQHTKLSRNYVVVTNGEEVSLDLKEHLSVLKSAGKLLAHIHSDDPLSPPVARQRGAAVADGRLLAFFDNHCLVARNYFERAALDCDEIGIESLRSSVVFAPGGPTQYHYRLKLEHNFWAEYAMLPHQGSTKPYKIAAAGHGGFVIKNSTWIAVGGYGPESLLAGYGGEEMLLDLKLWMFGHSNHLDPKLVHYHYSGKRAYARHYTDDYYRNMLVAANVIGGETWLNKVYESFAYGKHLRVNSDKTMYDLLLEAHERSAEYAREVAARRTAPLDSLIQWFRINQVAT